MTGTSDTYFMFGVALAVLILVIIIFLAGVHHRQHWETDRVVEGKLMRD